MHTYAQTHTHTIHSDTILMKKNTNYYRKEIIREHWKVLLGVKYKNINWKFDRMFKRKWKKKSRNRGQKRLSLGIREVNEFIPSD